MAPDSNVSKNVKTSVDVSKAKQTNWRKDSSMAHSSQRIVVLLLAFLPKKKKFTIFLHFFCGFYSTSISIFFKGTIHILFTWMSFAGLILYGNYHDWHLILHNHSVILQNLCYVFDDDHLNFQLHQGVPKHV